MLTCQNYHPSQNRKLSDVINYMLQFQLYGVKNKMKNKDMCVKELECRSIVLEGTLFEVIPLPTWTTIWLSL